MEATVYTIVYEPFRFGGSLYNPKKAVVECEALVEVGAGYKVYIFKSAEDRFHAAESTSGGLVGFGKSFNEVVKNVKKDIATADPKVMKEQVRNAVEQVKQAAEIDGKELIRLLSKGK